MSRLRPAAGLALAAVALAAALAAPACGGLREPSYQDALAAWRRGDRATSLALCHDKYARFQLANDLDDAQVRDALARAMAELEERPVVTPTDRAAPPLGDDPLAAPPDALPGLLRADLLSRGATTVLRAVLVVRDLGLPTHAPGLIAVVFSHEPLLPDGGALDQASPALRTVSVKRLALDALEKL